MPTGKVQRRKYDAPLSLTGKPRTVQCSVTPDEHAAVKAAHPEHGAVSTLLRETVERLAGLDLEPAVLPSERERRYLSAQLTEDEIAAISAAAAACVLEPTVLLRLAVLARARVGTGEALWQVLRAVRR